MSNRHHHAETEHHILPVRTYLLVFAALIVLLVATVGVAYIDLGPFSLAVALLIATIKAVLILLIFMHVLYVHDKVIWIFAGLGFFWLHILFGLLLSDYIFRGWVGVPGK